MTVSPPQRSEWTARAGVALLILLVGIDFYFDVHERDVLSWMDPYQYYEFALGVLQGREQITGFEVPSIFPFFLLPALSLSPSIPAALWTNFALTLLMLLALAGLRRELSIRTPSVLIAILVLSSPLLLGLSRTLYVEYALTVSVAFAALAWLRFSRAPAATSAAIFALAFGLGFMLKMTFPLFFFLPVAVTLITRIASGRTSEAITLAAAVLMPATGVLLVQALVFPDSFAYYLSLGNTSLPIMNLIGPPEWMSWRSAGYYFVELWHTQLFLLTPLLALPAWQLLRRSGSSGVRDPWDGPLLLWLWLLGPLLLLIVQPVKEPRHVAPCVIPAVLLIVLAIESLPERAARAATLVAVSLALLQLGLVTRGRLETPYFMDRPLHWKQIRQHLQESSPKSATAPIADSNDELRWNYSHNFVIDGFPPNEALAFTWLAFPGVVFDLEALRDPERLSAEIPYARFEDLYLLTAFNTYNRRCGWHWYYETLPGETAVQNADFVVLQGATAEQAARRFPDHALIATVERGTDPILVLRAREPSSTPYRALYAQQFLRRNPTLPDGERRVVGKDLWMAASLGGHEDERREISTRFPSLAEEGSPLRNIYWIGGYDALEQLVLWPTSSTESR